eukprot:CAMPEP_0171098860 /NCGR_PEP_ID=MMETSP0766_2-20121228/49704_1 /TAXON_ID=439317 /ORGANISM="Gambierdiscus australes, Strain CAWD 149" /LENGTH=59 /DNA_ID=CAMNT_0011558323 /DNA_START=102 /DNA_END=281 /DNA_ORIENTATION=+
MVRVSLRGKQVLGVCGDMVPSVEVDWSSGVDQEAKGEVRMLADVKVDLTKAWTWSSMQL